MRERCEVWKERYREKSEGVVGKGKVSQECPAERLRCG